MPEPHPSGTPSPAGAVAAQLPRRVPGLSIAVVDPGGVRWTRSWGLASIAGQRPVTPATNFLWFSMTKIMTATAVMLLVQRGALGMEEPAARYLPELAADYSPAGGTAVSLRHLLSHQSGLPNPIPLAWVHPQLGTRPDQSGFALKLLGKHSRPRFRPGSRAEYSNLNYLALGEIISRASAQPFEDFVRQELLAPLGMLDTDFHYRPSMLGAAATGYQARGNPLNPLLRQMLPAGIWGTTEGRFIALQRFEVDGAAYGGLIGPAADAAKLLRLHLPASAGKVEGRELLAPELLLEMQRLQGRSRQMEIGLGWFRWRKDGARGPHYIEHQGSGAGFMNCLRIYPELNLGLVLMGNSTFYKYNEILDAVCQQALSGTAGAPVA